MTFYIKIVTFGILKDKDGVRVKGPHLFESIREPWASTGINATAAILIAYPAPARAYVYDFETNQMVEYPYLPESILNVPYHFAAVFSLATLIDKTQRK